VVDNLTALCYNYYISKETNKQLRKRNKMKNIVSILAVVAATATSVSAAETTQGVNWAGSAVDLPDACVFTKSVDGEMTYAENSDDQGGVWTVTKAAELKVSMRGALSSFTVVPDSDIERVGGLESDQTTDAHTMYAVTVDYTAGNLTEVKQSVRNKDVILTGGGNDITSGVVSAEKIDLGFYKAKHLNIKLGGTATMNFTGALIDNGKYTLGHTATCVQ
jgi:predicted small secreted protein